MNDKDKCSLKSSIIGSAYLISACILIVASVTGNVNEYVGIIAMIFLIFGIGITVYNLIGLIKF